MTKLRQSYYTIKSVQTGGGKKYKWFIRSVSGEVLQETDALFDDKEAATSDCIDHINEYYY